MLIAATLLMGVGQGLINPTLSSYISKVAPATHRGGILGLAHSMNALARVAGPPIAGLAYDAYRAPGALLAQAFIVCLGITLAVRLMTGVKREAPAVP